MSIVRLELTILDGDAYGIANKLAAEYADPAKPLVDGCTGAFVRVFTDAEIQRERVILQAASYFMQEATP